MGDKKGQLFPVWPHSMQLRSCPLQQGSVIAVWVCAFAELEPMPDPGQVKGRTMSRDALAMSPTLNGIKGCNAHHSYPATMLLLENICLPGICKIYISKCSQHDICCSTNICLLLLLESDNQKGKQAGGWAEGRKRAPEFFCSSVFKSSLKQV